MSIVGEVEMPGLLWQEVGEGTKKRGGDILYIVHARKGGNATSRYVPQKSWEGTPISKAVRSALVKGVIRLLRDESSLSSGAQERCYRTKLSDSTGND